MKVAIIGCGSIGRRHLGNLIGLGVVPEDITVFDTRELDGVEHGGVRVKKVVDGGSAASLKLALFEAVVIATPAAVHAPYVKAAIAARVPFLLEKPATLGVAELTDAEWTTDVPHLVGYHLRWHHAHEHWRRANQARFSIACNMSSWPGRGYASAVWECSHEIDLALYLFGRPTSIRTLKTHRGDIHVWLTHASGAETEVAIDGASDGYFRQWMAAGDGWMSTFGVDKPEALQGATYTSEVRDFLGVVTGQVRSRCTLRDARSVVEICEQAERSAA